MICFFNLRRIVIAGDINIQAGDSEQVGDVKPSWDFDLICDKGRINKSGSLFVHPC
jgi:hypothetical protein